MRTANVTDDMIMTDGVRDIDKMRIIRSEYDIVIERVELGTTEFFFGSEALKQVRACPSYRLLRHADCFIVDGEEYDSATSDR
jgi:hypothetical protein